MRPQHIHTHEHTHTHAHTHTHTHARTHTHTHPTTHTLPIPSGPKVSNRYITTFANIVISRLSAFQPWL